MGFLSGRRWGYRLGMILLVAKLLSDLLNATVGLQPYAWWSASLTTLILLYLSTRQVKRHFSSWLGF